MSKITVAICSYNRSARLPPLIRALRQQESPEPFDILIVNNNSTDNTEEVLRGLQKEPGAPLRYVNELQQGIPFARNRAVSECLNREFMLFMDDDEMPRAGLVAAAIRGLQFENTMCVGGRVKVDFSTVARPKWLGDELLGFLAEVDYGDHPFWITSEENPVWTANVAYRMAIFRDDPLLRFDERYNRRGKGVGGGSDLVMFNDLLARRIPMRYCPDMVVDHHIEEWRLRRTYFLRLHYTSGIKSGRWQLEEYDRTVMGIPPFLIKLAVSHILRTGSAWLTRRKPVLRQAMNAAHAIGLIVGSYRRWKDKSVEPANGTK